MEGVAVSSICGDDEVEAEVDTVGVGVIEDGAVKEGSVGVGVVDEGLVNEGTVDVDAVDVGVVDEGPLEEEAVDKEVVDEGPADVGPVDVVTIGVGVVEVGTDDVETSVKDKIDGTDENEVTVEGLNVEVVEESKSVFVTVSKDVEKVDNDRVVEVVGTPQIVGDDMRVVSVEKGGGVDVKVGAVRDDEVSRVEVPSVAVNQEDTEKSSVDDEIDDASVVDDVRRVVVEDSGVEVEVASGVTVDVCHAEVVDVPIDVGSKKDEVGSTVEEGESDVAEEDRVQVRDQEDREDREDEEDEEDEEVGGVNVVTVGVVWGGFIDNSVFAVVVGSSTVDEERVVEVRDRVEVGGGRQRSHVARQKMAESENQTEIQSAYVYDGHEATLTPVNGVRGV
ncbi:hypothetical protein FRC07_009854, partial [Ceratobasidium sp. 392]